MTVSDVKVLMSLEEWHHSWLPSTPAGPTRMTPFPLTLPIAQPQDLGHIQSKNRVGLQNGNTFKQAS